LFNPNWFKVNPFIILKLIHMKKISFVFMLALSAWTFQACNNEAKETDSVENAEEANESKETATTVKEDDSEFLVEAASGGLMEVQAGELASTKAQNARVKAFGAMMVRDHGKANEELKALASSKNITIPTTPGEDHQKHINDLNQKSGKDFDNAYMSMMVDDHKDDVDKFESASNNAKDAAVKAFAAKTLPVLRAHLDSARAINDAIK
jgi:putative membrane protein